MFSEALRDLTKPKVLPIIEAIKRSKGITVADLAREIGMSYMGVKQHCQKLEAAGFLTVWRVPRNSVGRPEQLYLLTPKCDELFPHPSTEMVLDVMDGVKKFFGGSAPEKIFFHHFERQRAEWAPLINRGKSQVEKATRLADLRDKAGCFSRCKYDNDLGFRIEEFHHPLKELFAQYPGLVKQELRMMEKLLGCKVVRREVPLEKGGMMVIYNVGTLG